MGQNPGILGTPTLSPADLKHTNADPVLRVPDRINSPVGLILPQSQPDGPPSGVAVRRQRPISFDSGLAKG